MAMKVSRITQALDGSVATMTLTCLLGIASYFFGQPTSIELHWFWMALASLCIVGLAILQFARARRIQRRDDELSAVINAVPHILFFKDTDSRYRTLNAEFEKAFHIDTRAAVGKTDQQLFGPDLHERFVSQDRELLASGLARTYDDEMVVDGVVRSLQSRKRPVYDRNGRLRGIVGVAIDVTEDKAIQRRLEDASARLAIALEAARMGFWEWNLATGEIRADDRARQNLGIHATEHDVSAVFANLHPNDLEDVRASAEFVRTRQEVAASEFRVIDPSGAERWVEGFISPDRVRGGDDFLVGVNRDITERRKGELELSEAKTRADEALAELELSRSNLELALSVGGLGVWRSLTVLPEGSYLTDPAFLDTVVTADLKFRELYGQGPDSVVTYRDLLLRLHPKDSERVAARIDLTYRRGLGAYKDRFRVCGRDGLVRTLDVRGSMSRHIEGGTAAISFTGIAKDVTNEEALKADLVAKAEEARSAVEAKAHFLAMMSHEVRTPLNGVLGMIDLVIDTPLTEEQRGMLTRSRESSVALLTIINDILDFSKIEARMLSLEHRPLSLDDLIDNVCATLAPEAERKGIRLDIEIDPQLPSFIDGDSVRIRQVLTNLISNAVKFTHQGGVKVQATRLSEEQFQLSVRDTGIGIDPRMTKSLFEPFRQADAATTRRYGGTGLGLTIVKQLIELMQGRIDCESRLNAGSRFVVTLPLHPSTPDRDSPRRPRPMSDADVALDHGKSASEVRPETVRPPSSHKVLLAEDHPINREVITRQLAKLGYECDCAEDGEQAWERLISSDADYLMMLTDCRMPFLDGYELTKRLRTREAKLGLPRLPIVALTASALHGEAERCLALGMDAYLSKPLQLDDLRKTMTEVTSRRPKRDIAESESDAIGATARDPGTAYGGLTALCGGDLRKVARLVDIFVTTTSDDLKAMERAYEAGDHVALRQLAHRLSSACHQLDETEAVARLQALERLEETEHVGLMGKSGELYESARLDVSSVLLRASEFARMHV